MMRRLILLGLVIVFTLTAAGCVEVPVSGQWDFGIRSVPVYGRQRIGQDFNVSDRNLTRVDIFFYPSRILKGRRGAQRRLALRSLKGKDVVLRLYGLPEKKPVAISRLPVAKVRDTRMYAFRFKPLASSKHRRFYFELEAPSLVSATAVSVRMTEIDRYKDGNAFINGRARAGADLGFQSYIDMTAVVLIHSVAARLAADLPFIVVWSLMVLAVLALTIRAWWRQRLIAQAIAGKT